MSSNFISSGTVVKLIKPNVLRKAETLHSFGLSEYNRVKSQLIFTADVICESVA